jgi:hypothetical protein
MVPMNLNDDEAYNYAAMIECYISSFSIIYLGLPLYDRTLKISDWNVIVATIQNKLANWKGTLLSLRGRLTMVNDVLSAVLLYRLFLYKIPIKVRKRIDTIRGRFFWQGSSNHRKNIT